MYVIELFLPIRTGGGAAVPASVFSGIENELTATFGGVTSFVRNPARGQWTNGGGRVERDDIVVFEVMADTIDRNWWNGYREKLRRLFEQEEVLVRAVEASAL